MKESMEYALFFFNVGSMVFSCIKVLIIVSLPFTQNYCNFCDIVTKKKRKKNYIYIHYIHLVWFSQKEKK